jgi:SLT domain-containing protein
MNSKAQFKTTLYFIRRLGCLEMKLIYRRTLNGPSMQWTQFRGKKRKEKKKDLLAKKNTIISSSCLRVPVSVFNGRSKKT